MSRPVCQSGEVTPSKATLITLVAWPGCENLNGQVGLDWDGQNWTTDPLVTGPVTFSLVSLGNDQFRIDWDLGCDSGSESAGGSCDGLALLAVAPVSPTCCTDPDPIGAVNMEISTGAARRPTPPRLSRRRWKWRRWRRRPNVDNQELKSLELRTFRRRG